MFDSHAGGGVAARRVRPPPRRLRVICLAATLTAAASWHLPVPPAAAAPRATGRWWGRSRPVSCCAAGDALPTVPIRAPRRLRNDEPTPTGERTRQRKRGGTQAPQGRDAVAARPQGRAKQVRELQRLHISGGRSRGRRITTPAVYMRPMMSRVREALFSMLYPSGVLRPSARHLDLFAGSGVVGLESLSRGVGHASFVDFSSKCTGAIRKNAEVLGYGESVHVVEAKVDAFLATPERFGVTQPFDLVAITPPYEEVVYAELMEQCASSAVLGEDSLVVVEYPIELGCFPPTLADGRLIGLRNRKYGRTVIAIYVNRPSGRLDMSPWSEEFVAL